MAQLDYSQDWRCWDNVRRVTYVSTRNPVVRPSDPSGQTLPQQQPNPVGLGSVQDLIQVAKKRSVTIKEITASNGAYQSGDVAFLLPGALITTSIGQPKAGDKVIDSPDGDGSTYTVLQPIGQRMDGSGTYATWKLMTRNLSVAFDLADQITIEEPVETLDSAAAGLKQWRTKYTGLLAKVQLITQEQADALGIRGFRMAFQVIVSEEISVRSRDRIVWPASPTGYLDITGYHNAQRLDELPVIDAIVPVG